MSITVGEAVQRVQSLYSKGVQSKDTRLAPRHIYSSLKTARSTVIRQQYNKNQSINHAFYQILTAIELQKADITGLKATDNTILRSAYKIPTFVSGIDKDLIKSFTNLDGTLEFDRSDFENIKHVKGNKYTPNNPRYFFRNSYTYLSSLKWLRGGTMEALFDDPIEAANFPSLIPCDDCDCRPFTDYDFYVDGNAFKTIADIAYQELVIEFTQMKEDKQANANDDNSISGNMIHQPNNPNNND